MSQGDTSSIRPEQTRAWDFMSDGFGFQDTAGNGAAIGNEQGIWRPGTPGRAREWLAPGRCTNAQDPPANPVTVQVSASFLNKLIRYGHFVELTLNFWPFLMIL